MNLSKSSVLPLSSKIFSYKRVRILEMADFVRSMIRAMPLTEIPIFTKRQTCSSEVFISGNGGVKSERPPDTPHSPVLPIPSIGDYSRGWHPNAPAYGTKRK